MALNLSKDYTFSSNTTIASAEVNTNFDELYSAFSGLEAGSSSMSKLPLDADPSSALHAATKQYVDAYANYRRPGLSYVSATAVDVEVNTGTANTTKIIFPDGNYRSVTEDTSSTHKYRRFIITAAAEFGSGTEDSGLRSGLSEATDTWYAIYAVKSTINTANFILAGDTTLPVIGSVSTLNSRYGTNGWVYLGMIRNGDNSGTTGDILNFIQNGAVTIFYAAATGNVVTQTGLRLATSAGATSLTYTYASGTGTAQIPSHLTQALYQGASAAGSGSAQLADSGGSKIYLASDGAVRFIGRSLMVASDGAQVTNGSSSAMDVFLGGYVDSVLGNGSNPFI